MDGIWRLGIKQEDEMATRIKTLEREKGGGPEMKESWLSNLISQRP